jgi:hypothetical protein
MSARGTKPEWAHRAQHIRSWGDSGRIDRTVSTAVGTLAFNAHDATERARYLLTLFAATQAAQEPRRQKLIADVLDDLWRFSCEMPDAPDLSKN